MLVADAGVVDNATVRMMKTPRCGVTDPSTHRHRAAAAVQGKISLESLVIKAAKFSRASRHSQNKPKYFCRISVKFG